MPHISQPNIVLINVDQWRGDCLSISGHPVVHTPFLDGLADGGARFNRAYTACPTCIPARAALYTGLSQATHGRVGYQDGVPWNYPVTIAGEFTRHGYQTQAVGKLHVYPERSQMGFQNVILHDGYLTYARTNNQDYSRVDDYNPWLHQQLGREADDFDHGVFCNSIAVRPWDKPEYTHPTNFVVSQSIDFLRRRDPRKPFFLFLSFHRPHPPYDPPAWALEQYLNQAMPEPPVGDWADDLEKYHTPHDPNIFLGKLGPQVLQRVRAGYYGLMTHIDHQINRFLVNLEHYGVRENTYICFVSDHGNSTGDHHLYRKSLPYESAARVPLILAGPKGSGIQPRSAYNQVVELRDIMPTLLDCAELPIPESVEGQSFLPIARGQPQSWRIYLHGEHTFYQQSVHWITDGHCKYIWFSGDGLEQFFDLDQDPQELHELSHQPNEQDRLMAFRKHLIVELTGREEGFTDGENLIVGRPVKNVLSHVNRFM